MNPKTQLLKDFIFIIILSLSLFTFCCSPKRGSVLVKDSSMSGGSSGVQVDSLIVFQEEFEENIDDIIVKSSPPPLTGSGRDVTSPKPNPQTINSENYDIQVASGDIKPNYLTGKISYSIPDTMEYLKQERVVLRIAKEEMDEIMVMAYGTPVKEKFVLIDKIRVGNIMSAELIDLSTGKSFEIKELSSKEQNIDEQGYTEWQWLVKPLKSGEIGIKLVVKVVVEQNGKTSIKDIPVFERDIYIIAKPLKSVWVFIQSYWQWLFTVLLIPLFKYLWGLRKKKKEEGKEE